MRILLFASLREIAGTDALESSAVSVGDLIEELTARLGPEFARILRAGAIVVNGSTAGPDQALSPDDEVGLLPPVSGGAGMRPSPRALFPHDASRKE
ncbi:MAG: MoaD/ThiS family protein [Actinobacteria bacterium]|nr:MoaD/ThiS family protein [Actinomycetota bacterium]